jgi:carbon-monoxide dehydrogenase small subunit
VKIELEINGAKHTVEAPPMARLLDVLREDVGLTGTKEGCGEGECGACTVLLDGKPVNACLVPVAQAQGAQLKTVEGLAHDGVLTEVQQALATFGGAQCGICSPGIAVCAQAALDRDPNPSREQIRELLAGNLCRCTGYQLIVDAVADAVAKRGGA